MVHFILMLSMASNRISGVDKLLEFIERTTESDVDREAASRIRGNS